MLGYRGSPQELKTAAQAINGCATEHRNCLTQLDGHREDLRTAFVSETTGPAIQAALNEAYGAGTELLSALNAFWANLENAANDIGAQDTTSL